MRVSPTLLALLLTAGAAVTMGAAAVHALHGLRRQVGALRTELAESLGSGLGPGLRDPRTLGDTAAGEGALRRVPGARGAADADEIRMAVAEALADEREREMAEARAFWAAQEARDASSDASPLLGLPSDAGPVDPVDPALPRRADLSGRTDFPDVTHVADLTDLTDLTDFTDLADLAGVPGGEPPEPAADADDAGDSPGDSPELAAARRRHPSHPGFVPTRSTGAAQPPHPAGGNHHERVVACFDGLAAKGTALADVRPGPLGTLDVYVFEDGTTLCMTPGHRETAARLADALRRGDAPVLLGGSALSGAYTLTFACGGEHVYVLADRVIASY